MSRIRKSQSKIPEIGIEPAKEEDLTEVQNNELNYALAMLKPNQLKSAMLESSGTSKQLIAMEIGVAPATISSWGTDPYYIKVLHINKTILEKQGREFRVKQVKQIIAPAYMELIERMSDPIQRKSMDVKDLLNVIKTMTNEIRQDLSGVAEESDEYNELVELQKRRKHLALLQNKAIDDLEQDSNIIRLPISKVG